MDDTLVPRPRVLVIDDEESMRHALAKALARGGYDVIEAATGREGRDRFAAGGVDAVLTDMRLPDLGGLDLVAIFTEMRPEVPVILMTGYGSLESALEAMRRGAKDYVQKPFAMEDILRLLTRALAEQRLALENKKLRALVERRFAPEEFERVERELEALTLATLAEDEAVGAAAAERAAPGGEPLPLRDAQRRFEVRYVESLLVRTGGNVAAAARLAGISRPNFHKKLKTLGVDATRFKEAARRGRHHD
ncbi:MAG: response regulator [Planctomycetota bacterium]